MRQDPCQSNAEREPPPAGMGQVDDLPDVALTAYDWATRASLPPATRDLARHLFNFTQALSEQESVAAPDRAALDAMVEQLSREIELTDTAS